jgi:hypothetical protein
MTLPERDAGPLPMAGTATAAAAARCLNCGNAAPHRFCASCGQRAIGGRLTLRGLWDEFAQQFLALDRGLWFTAAELTLRPGDVIRRYLDGQRRRYVGPVSYLFFGTALLLLAMQLSFGDRDLEAIRKSATYMTEPGRRGAFMSPRQADAYARLMFEMTRNMTARTLGMAVPFALLLRRLFRRTGINLAEAGVFTLYAFAHTCVLYAPFEPLFAATDASMNARGVASMVAYVAVCTHAALGFFGRRLGSAVRVNVAFFGSYFLFLIPLGMAAVFYVVRTVPR